MNIFFKNYRYDQKKDFDDYIDKPYRNKNY